MTRTLGELRRELLANSAHACSQRLPEEAYEAGRADADADAAHTDKEHPRAKGASSAPSSTND